MYAAAPGQLDSLQNQVNALEQQMQALQASPALMPSVGLDTQNPFGAQLDTSYPLTVMKFKEQFPAALTLGTKFEVDAQVWNGSFSKPIDPTTSYQSGTDFALTTTKIYSLANMGDWVTGFFVLDAATNQSETTSFEQAFLNIGNLQKTPFFMTLGDAYLPFGVFNGAGFWTDNLDIVAFRNSTENQIGFNFYQDGWYTNLAFFNQNVRGSSALGDFSYSVNYATTGYLNGAIGAGYLYDVRGTSTGVGAAYPTVGSANNTIAGSRNAVYDLNALVAYGPCNVAGEADLTAEGAQNLNGSSTGQMSAWNVISSCSTRLGQVPTSFYFGYSATHNMNNIPMPLNGMATTSVSTQATDNNAGMAHQWLLFMSNEFFTNVYMTPEYEYSTLYNGTHTWTLTYDVTAYL